VGKISPREIYEKGKVGVMAGFVSGLVIFVAFTAIDSELKPPLSPWAFQTMIGLAVGLNGPSATLFGVLAHMLTAMTIGAVFCICSALHPLLHLNSAWKGALGGGVTGLEVYAIFFMPITLFIVLPAIDSISNTNPTALTDDDRSMLAALKTNMPLIMWGAMVIHILYGSIMGIYSSMSLSEKYMIQKKLDVKP
jgi:hypothetical protein